MNVSAGVAAGHPATADAGAEILADGGSAADAAVAAALASCVAETVMTGLLGGGHAIYFDAGSGIARNLDCFCAVPGLGAPARDSELLHMDVPFGAELVHYAVGPASCAVPGVPAGLHALWEAHGRLPWTRLVEPALQLAHDGVAMPAAHVSCLEMLEPVMTLREGARMYAPGGSLLRAGELLQQPGLVRALELIAAEGAAGAYHGTIAASLLELSDERGGLLTAGDLDAYEPVWSAPTVTSWLGMRFLSRGGLSGVPETLARLPRLRELSAAARVPAVVDALDSGAGLETHTTNLVTVDADGNACVLTTSLGLGSGDWLPGLDLHLNSMLGEVDLLLGPARAWRPDGEHDGALRRARRSRARARTRCRGRYATPQRARRRRGRDSRRRARAAGRRRPRTGPPRRRARECRAGCRRNGARATRGSRAHGAPLARASPLLRRRQRTGTSRGRGRPSTERSGAYSTGRVTGIQPR